MRVARRYDEDSVTAFAARGALGATYVVMSNLYAHGIAQPYVRDAFVRLASAAALTPEELYGDPDALTPEELQIWRARLWPLVGAGLQGALLFAPLVAAVLAAGSSYAVEQAIIAPWRPAAPSETEIEEACARAEKYFQVTAPPERAGPRAAAFRAAADRWRDDRRADERRDYYRAAATAGSAAVAGTWLAPCLAQLVAFGLAVVRDREGGSSPGLGNDDVMVSWRGAPVRPSSGIVPRNGDDLGPLRDRLRDRRRVELDVAVVLAAREGEVSAQAPGLGIHSQRRVLGVRFALDRAGGCRESYTLHAPRSCARPAFCPTTAGDGLGKGDESQALQRSHEEALIPCKRPSCLC